MSYKNILVYLDQGASNAERINTAASLALHHDAKLTAVAVHALPSSRMLQKLGLAGADDALKDAHDLAQYSLDDFIQQMQKGGVEADSIMLECKESEAPEKLARLVRSYDLCILRQANPKKSNADFINDLTEGVLFSSGRPVMFIPYIGAHNIPCQRGMIAWDGSAAASRAVHDALPLLTQMQEVIILVVDAHQVEKSANNDPGDALLAHLKSHSVNAKISHLSSDGTKTSTVILNAVADNGTDLLVMGGYGTPKLREMILGGVTRTFFDVMTVPVFMSH